MVNDRAVSREVAATGRNVARCRIAIVLVAAVLGTFWRLLPVGSAFLFGDEFHSLRLIVASYGEILTTYGRFGSGLLLPLVQRVLGDLIGYNHWTVRLPAWLPGLILLWTLYPAARRSLGRNAAALGVVLMSGNSMLVFYSHFGRTYMLVAALSMALVLMLQRVVETGRCDWRTFWLCALVTALLPYAHLISVGLILPVYGAAALALCVRPETRRSALIVLLPLVLGGLVCLALYAPAWESYQQFVAAKSERDYFGSFTILDVGTVLMGGQAAGVVWVVLTSLGIVWLLARRRWRSLPIVFGCVGPVIALLWARPYGDAYAWARYVIHIVPLSLLVIGSLLTGVASMLFRSQAVAEAVSLLAGLALALMCVLPGPLGPGAKDEGPYCGSYLDLVDLPAFDEAWPEMPEIYHELEQLDDDLVILELPGLFTRARHLYRNSYLAHGLQTRLALPEASPTVPAMVHIDGPYVFLSDPDWLDRADADWLIVHRSPRNETRAYWRFVYGKQDPVSARDDLAALMERHSRYTIHTKQLDAAIIEDLWERLGVPAYRDRYVSAWKLR